MKLRKRLPESKSQKKERLAGERERKQLDRSVMYERRDAWLAQQERSKGWQRSWEVAFRKRLDSDDAYAHFENVHRNTWDYLRHIGLPTTEFVLAMQRISDGKRADPESILDFIELNVAERHARYRVRECLHRLKKCRFTPEDTARLRAIAEQIIHLPYWHLGFRRLCQLVRVVDIGTLETTTNDAELRRLELHWHQQQARLQMPYNSQQ